MKAIIYRNLLYFGTILLTLITVTLSIATEYEAQFQQGLDDYKAGRFQKAVAEFRELALSETAHSKVSASLLMWARSLLKQDEYNQVLEVTSQLLSKFPGSSYVDDAHDVRAEAYFELKKPMDCAEELIWVIDNGTDERLVERAQNHLISLRLTLSERERHSLAAHTNSISTQNLISFGKTENPYWGQGLSIGVLLPLSDSKLSIDTIGLYQLGNELGSDLYQGIEFAYKEWKKTSNIAVSLFFDDSRGSTYETAKVTQGMLESDNVSMILCAGDEGTVIACATQAASKHIPCLILNPQTYPLSSLGEEIFQLYPDRRTEGEALGKFSVNNLGLRRFAIIAPATNEGTEIAGGFLQTVNGFGGKVLAEEFYYPGSVNFEKQFVHIRRLGWDIMKASNPDTFAITTEGTLTDSIWANMANGEVLDIKSEYSDESFDTPISTYDGFFIVADPGDLNILAPQYAFYNFSTQLLGSHDWDKQDSFQKNRNYISGMVYSTNVFWDPMLVSNSEWINDFRNSTGQMPNENSIMGYDGMRWVLKAIDSLVSEGLILQNNEPTPPLSPPTSVVGESSTPPLIPPAKQGGNLRRDTLQNKGSTNENTLLPRRPITSRRGENTLQNKGTGNEDNLLNINLSPERLLERLQEQTEYQGIGGLYRFQDGMNTEVSIVKYDKGKKELLNK